MSDLLKRQEAERQDLAAGAHTAWLSVLAKEEQLLTGFGNTYDNAPASVQDEINKDRQAYFDEWGSDGKLAALMTARHSKERARLIEREKIANQLQNRPKDKGRGR